MANANCLLYRPGQQAAEISFDEVSDIKRFADIIRSRPTCGCVVVGGGVPRNWAQQVFPYLDVLAR